MPKRKSSNKFTPNIHEKIRFELTFTVDKANADNVVDILKERISRVIRDNYTLFYSKHSVTIDILNVTPVEWLL